MSEENIILKFDTHSGMNRVPMKWGVPFVLLVVLVFLIVVSLAAGIYFFGWYGALCSAPFAIVLAAIKLLCALDDRALIRLRFVYRRHRLNKKYGRHLLFTPRNPEWSKNHARRIFKQNLLTRE